MSTQCSFSGTPKSPRAGAPERNQRLVRRPQRKNRALLVVSCATIPDMRSTVSVRELRNSVSMILRRVETGERVTVTVDRRPVAEIVPLQHRRNVTITEALAIASSHPADRALLDQLRIVFPDTTDDL